MRNYFKTLAPILFSVALPVMAAQQNETNYPSATSVGLGQWFSFFDIGLKADYKITYSNLVNQIKTNIDATITNLTYSEITNALTYKPATNTAAGIISALTYTPATNSASGINAALNGTSVTKASFVGDISSNLVAGANITFSTNAGQITIASSGTPNVLTNNNAGAAIFKSSVTAASFIGNADSLTNSSGVAMSGMFSAPATYLNTNYVTNVYASGVIPVALGSNWNLLTPGQDGIVTNGGEASLGSLLITNGTMNMSASAVTLTNSKILMTNTTYISYVSITSTNITMSQTNGSISLSNGVVYASSGFSGPATGLTGTMPLALLTNEVNVTATSGSVTSTWTVLGPSLFRWAQHVPQGVTNSASATTLAQCVIPGGLIGSNGTVEVTGLFGGPATNMYTVVLYGTTTMGGLINFADSTVQEGSFLRSIANANNPSAQISHAAYASFSYDGTVPNFLTFSTSTNFICSIVAHPTGSTQTNTLLWCDLLIKGRNAQ